MTRFLLMCIFVLSGTIAFAQTQITGKVIDSKGEPQIGASLALKQKGVLKGGATTEPDGLYVITGIDPGTYELEVTMVGASPNLITGVRVDANRTNRVDVTMESNISELGAVIITGYKVPLINLDNTTSSKTITAAEIQNIPTKSISGIVATTAGVSQADERSTQGITFRGSRSDANEIWIDGQRTRGGALPPVQDIEQLEVLTGGLPAAVGDITGGGISITTKGGAKKFTGGVEVESSQFLDAFGYNLIAANLAGPLVKKKNSDQAAVSFRISGQYRTRKDADPSAGGYYKVKDDVLADLQANPMVKVGTGYIARSQLLRESDVERISARQNSRDNRIDLNGKLDFRIAKGVDFTVGGAYSVSDDRLTTNSRTLLAADRNGLHNNSYARGWARLRHRIGGDNIVAEGAKKSNSFIENVVYSIQGGYSRDADSYQDAVHKERIWDYGYIGKFNQSYVPTFGRTGEHAGWSERFVNYERSELNAVLANYNNLQPTTNEQAGGTFAVSDYRNINGFTREADRLVYGNHINVGHVYNLYQKQENNTIEAKVDASFDILPGRSLKNRHSVQLGFVYEQRDDRSYSIQPRALWQAARQIEQSVFNGLDKQLGIGYAANGTPLFAPNYSVDDQAQFDKELRKSLNKDNFDYINTDGLTPANMRLGMFSADELTRDRSSGGTSLDYYGYDYLGNRLSDRVSFNDYYKQKDANGRYTRPVGSFQPIYTSGYIQDKFQLNDIIFRVGLRVDRFDANTKVLRDPFNFYKAYTAAEYATVGAKSPKPANIGDNWIVYNTNGDGSGKADDITAYRDGEKWYKRDGTLVNDPAVIFGSVQAKPALVESGADYAIKGTKFDPENTFKDYLPQINLMPRLAFSFPISKKAGFFAHYDVLTQRPGFGSTNATAQDYFYFAEQVNLGGDFKNANLRPEKTVDYEVGFQQEVTKTSALKVQAYYKEMRDMIQLRTFFNAFPLPYTSFDNIDFGTTKGLTFTFDQRRVENLQFNVAYTLQFADGTGSGTTTARGLSSRGNLRSIFPLSFDERHRLVFTVDYRYGEGKKYTGPKIGKFNLFENTGANLLLSVASGRPYTAKAIPLPFDGATTVGSINGARLPFNNSINLRIDRDIKINKSESNPLYVNVYFRIQNVLNNQNFLNVYEYTGSPFDDGYLATSAGQNAINTAADPAAYEMLYRFRMLNPDFISLPRRMFVGAMFTF